LALVDRYVNLCIIFNCPFSDGHLLSFMQSRQPSIEPLSRPTSAVPPPIDRSAINTALRQNNENLFSFVDDSNKLALHTSLPASKGLRPLSRSQVRLRSPSLDLGRTPVGDLRQLALRKAITEKEKAAHLKLQKINNTVEILTLEDAPEDDQEFIDDFLEMQPSNKMDNGRSGLKEVEVKTATLVKEPIRPLIAAKGVLLGQPGTFQGEYAMSAAEKAILQKRKDL